MKYFEVLLFKNGKKHILHVKSRSKIEVLNRIKNDDITILKIKEIPLPVSILIKDYIKPISDRFIQKKLNQKEFIMLLKQLSVMINAGIPLREALLDSKNSVQDQLIKKIVASVISDLDSGMSLTQAFKRFENEVGVITISMIDVGEKTGSLATSLLKLSNILQAIDENRIKIKNAIRMPLISLATMCIGFLILIILVVPKFNSLFHKMDSNLPIATKLLLELEYIITHYSSIIIFCVLIIYFCSKIAYHRILFFRIKLESLFLKIFLLGDILALGIYSRYMMVLSELVKAGIPLNHALNSAERIVENSYIRKKLKVISISIEQGTELAKGFDGTKLFSSMIINMIRAGERGGELDTMFTEISRFYNEKFQNLIDNLSTLIEPILMGFLALLVLFLALGIFLPIWELSSFATG